MPLLWHVAVVAVEGAGVLECWSAGVLECWSAEVAISELPKRYLYRYLRQFRSLCR